jgi:hypothetical protein
MYPSFFQLLAITAGTAVAAVLGIVLEAERVHKDPADYGRVL